MNTLSSKSIQTEKVEESLILTEREERKNQIFPTKVTNLVCGKISVALVQEIEKSVRLNKAIPDVETNVKSLFEQYAANPRLVKPSRIQEPPIESEID